MANNSRAERRRAEKVNRLYYTRNLRRFISLAHNSVRFEGLDNETPKRYLMKILIENGAIAYDKETGLYLRFTPSGTLDTYGLPTAYTLWGYDGLTLTRKPDEIVILRINDISEPIKPYLQLQAEKVVKFDTAIEQNLEAIRTMTIFECDSDNQALQMVNQAENRRIGATLFFQRRSSFSGVQTSATNTNAQYLIDKLMEARQKVLNETYASIGIATANTDKRERVQGLEVNTSLSFAMDSVYLITDTFNYDAERGGLSIRMYPNTSLIDLWGDKGENENKKDTSKDKGSNTENA